MPLPYHDTARSFDNYLSIEGVGHRKGAGDPAECVDDMRRKTIDDTTDGLPNVLCGRNDQTAAQQQNRREDIVQPKYSVVRLDLLDLEIDLKASQ